MSDNKDQIINSFVEKNLNTINDARQKAGTALSDFYNTNPDLIAMREDKVIAKGNNSNWDTTTGFDGAFQGDEEYYPQTNRLRDVTKDTLLSVGEGVVGAADGILGTAGMVSNKVGSLNKAITGQDHRSADEVILSLQKDFGTTDAKDWLQSNKSALSKRKQAELQSIMSNRDISEVDRAKQLGKFYGDNLGTLGLDTAKVIPQSVIEMATGTKVLNTVGKFRKANLATKAALTSGLGAYGSAVSEVAQDPDQELDTRHQVSALAQAAVVGGVTGGFAKYLPGDIDSLLVGGAAKQGILKTAAKGGLGEAPEEFIQEGAQNVIKNWADREDLSYGSLASALQGSILGATSGGSIGAVKGAGSKAQAKAIRQTSKPFNIEDTKVSPVQAFKDAVYDQGSDDIEVRKVATANIDEIYQQTTKKDETFKQLLETTTDPDKRKVIEAKYKEFSDTVMEPLQAEMDTLTSNIVANKEDVLGRLEAQMNKLKERNIEVQTNKYESSLPKSDPNYVPVTGSNTTSNISGSIPKEANKYQKAINVIGKQYGVDTALINAIVQTESNFDPNAKSQAGAIGLMQLMPATAKGLGVKDSSKPIDNLDGGVRYIAEELKRYNGNIDNALLAYNWGRGNVDAYLKTGKGVNGQPIPKEAREYANKVKAAMSNYGGLDLSNNQPKVSLGDKRYTNKDAYKGLRLKSNETIAGKNGALGATIEFAHVMQDTLGERLEVFTAFDDSYSRKAKNHSGGKGIDIRLKDGLNLAESNKAEQELYAQAKAAGYEIKVLNEYDPKKRTKGSAPHMHVTVVGRTSSNGYTPNVDISDTDLGTNTNYEINNIPEIKIDPTLDDLVSTKELTEEEKVIVDAVDETRKRSQGVLRKLFSTLNPEEIESSTLLNDKQKEALRSLTQYKLNENKSKSVDKVRMDVMQGSDVKGTRNSYIGIKDYEQILTQAVNNNDSRTATKYMDYLNRFADSHESKALAIKKALTQSSRDNPITLLPNKDGIWEAVDVSKYSKEELANASPFVVTTSNKGTTSILNEAKTLKEFRDVWLGITESFVDGVERSISPVVTPKKVNNPTVPVDTTEATVETPMRNTEGFTRVDSVKDVPTDGVYLGREEGTNSSMSAIKPSKKDSSVADNVGKQGWLASRHNGKDKDANMDKYISDIKSNSNKFDNFVQGIIDLKGKDLYGNTLASSKGEIPFIVDLVEQIPKDLIEAKAYINNIKEYKNGIKLIDKPLVPKVKVSNNTLVNDSTFGFNDVNQFNLKTTNDETLESNKVKIDNAIKSLKGKEFPSNGLGKSLSVNAPKTLEYLNQTIKNELGIDNQLLLDNAPKEVTNNRSSVESNAKRKGVKASNTIKPKKGKIEKSAKTKQDKETYSNVYKAELDNGSNTTISIQRDNKTNAITNVKVTTRDLDNKATDIPYTAKDVMNVTDNDIIQEANEGLNTTFNQIDVNELSTIEEAPELTTVNNVKVPVALKETKVLEEVMDTLIPYISKVSKKELGLYTSIIKPILNFNPLLKVVIKNSNGKSIYDSEANTIILRSPLKGSNLLQELTRLVVYSSTSNLVNKLNDSEYSQLIAEDTQLSKLNKDLTESKQILENTLNNSKTFKELSKQEKSRLVEALESNSKFLSMVTTDPVLIRLLRGISVPKRKTKSSLFRKITTSLRNFFNLASNNETATMYDRILEITARTVELQSRNSDVNFNKSMQGKVKVFQDLLDSDIANEQAKNFYDRNLFISGFTQTQTNDKPLSSVSNLASKLKIDLMQGLGALTKLSPTKAQRDQVVDLLDFRDEISQHLLDTFKQSDKSYAEYKDLKTYLMDESGSIDENTITAVSVGIYDWIAENGNKNKSTDKDIRNLLNLEIDGNEYIPKNIREQYEHKLSLQAQVANSIGKKVTSALNIKANDTLQGSALSALNNSIGLWAISAMQSSNLIYLESMSTKDHIANINEVGGDLSSYVESVESNGYGELTFVNILDSNGLNKNRKLEEIAQLNKSTLGYLSDLFGVENTMKVPQLNKPTKLINKIKKTVAKVSSTQLEYIKTMQEEVISIDDVTYDSLVRLLNQDNDKVREMLGAKVTEEKLNNTHVDDRYSLTSAADGVQRELENALGFVDNLDKDSTGKRTGFYDQVYVAKNNRMHYYSNMFNFQTSKLHRALAQYSNFETVLDTSSLSTGSPAFFNDDGSTTELGYFYRAIAEQAEGTEDIMEEAMKGTSYTQGFTVDKIPSIEFLPRFYNYLSTDDDVKAAIEATTKLLNNTKLTKNELDSIVNLVNFWEGKAGSFRALVELTKLTNNTSDSFTTSIGLSSDGVNNGIAISQVLMGTANQTFLDQVGMFTADSKFSNYYETRADRESGDYYESYTKVLDESIVDIKKELNDKDLNSLNAVLNLHTSMKGRKFAKAILIPFGYSAGMKRLKALGYSQFLDDIKTSMVKIAKLDPNSQEAIDKHALLTKELNNILDSDITLPVGKELLEVWFDKPILTELATKYNSLMGEAINQSLNNYAGEFMAVRNLNVKLQNAASDIYLELRKEVIDSEFKKYSEIVKQDSKYSELTDKQLTKLIAVEGIPKAYFDTNIAPKLKELRPTVKTPLNHKTDDTESNFVLTRETNVLEADRELQAANWVVDSNNELVLKYTYLSTEQASEEGVGVMTNSAQVQGMDAYIAARTSAQGGTVNINVHDAGISGLNNYVAMVKEQNKATYEGLRDYASQVESLNALIDLLNKLDNDQSIEYQENIINTIYGEDSNNTFADLINEVSENQTNKVNIVNSIKTVHQYAGENGEYTVNKESINLDTSKSGNPIHKIKSTPTTNKYEVSTSSVVTLPEEMLNKVFLISYKTKELKEISSGLLNDYEEEYTNGVRDIFLNLASKSGLEHSVELVDDAKKIAKIESQNNGEVYIANVLMDDVSGVAKLRMDVNQSLFDVDLKTILTHELTHVVTKKAIKEVQNNNPVMESKIVDAYNTVSTWLNKNENNLSEKSRESFKYSLLDLDEFIAVSMTQDEVMDYLIDIPYKNGNMKEAIVGLTVELLEIGFPNLVTPEIKRELNVLSKRYETEQRKSRKSNKALPINPNSDKGFEKENRKDAVTGTQRVFGQSIGQGQEVTLSTYLGNLKPYLKDMITKYNPNLKIQRSTSINNNGEIAKGVYDSESNKIFINTNIISSTEDFETVKAHEVIHAITSHNIFMSNSEHVTNAITQLEAMMNDLRETATDPFIIKHVLSSVSEFVAYGLSEKKYLQYIGQNLRGEYRGTGKRMSNKLKAFVDYAMTLFTGKREAKNIEAYISLINELTKGEYIQGSTLPLFSTVNTIDAIKQLSTDNVSSDFSEHLNKILDTSVLGFYNRNETSKVTIDNILANPRMTAINAGFTLSDKELHTMEIVKAMGTSYLEEHSNTKTVSEMRELFNRITKQLTKTTFLRDATNPTTLDLQQAESMYKYIMDQTKRNKREQVESFFALAIASEQVSNVIKDLDNTKEVRESDTLFNKLMAKFETIVRWMTSTVLNTKGMNAPQELNALFTRLSVIDYDVRRGHVNLLDRAYKVAASNIAKPADFVTTKLINGLFTSINFTGNKIPAFSAMSSFANKARFTGVMSNVDTLVNNPISKNESNRLNGFGEILNELANNTGMTNTVEKLIRMTNKIGQLRQSLKDNGTNALKSYFTNNANDLSKDQLDSISQAGLRTDMSSLLNNGYSITQVLGLLSNFNKVSNEIDKLENIIKPYANSNDILMQTKSLGLYMAKEIASDFLVKNAEGIATGLDSWYQTDLSNMDNDLRDAIDTLASLYALEFVPSTQRASLAELIAQEPEGVKAVLKAHKDATAKGKEEFGFNPYSYSKGYMPQNTHHLRSLKFAETKEEVTKLEAMGWEKVSAGELNQDPLDRSEPRTLMFHKDMSYQDYVSGALDMKDTHSKGTQVYSESDILNLNRVNASKLKDRRRRNNMSFTKYDPKTSSSNKLVAEFDGEGYVKGYHYEMSGQLRDTYLERDNDGLTSMGILQSDLAVKPDIRESQRNVAKELYQDYVNDYGKDPRKFVVLSRNSADPKVATMWNMMPEAFKQESEMLFGKDKPIVVRSNVFNAVFGFKAYSLSEMFDKVNDEKNGLEKFLTTILNAIFRDKAKMRTIQGERMWQDVITNIKDFVVIRNVKVMIGNIVANSLLLSLNGVTPTQQAKDFVSVWRNGGKYRKDAARIMEIDQELRVNTNRPNVLAKLNREKNILEKAMSQNPLHAFMEAGLMSTIVEDVKTKDDTGFQSEWDKKISALESNIPKQVVTGFQWAITSPGTPLHDFMSHSTQFSDLAAKYSLATQLMREGKTMEQGISAAQDNFINYDVPTSKGIDYLNRMGLFMFTKFFIRFQKVLMSNLNKRAGSTIAQHVGIEYFTGLSGVLDPLAVTRIGNNPIEAGIFNYGEAFNNISTVDAISSIFN